jgi:hypothetical protein
LVEDERDEVREGVVELEEASLDADDEDVGAPPPPNQPRRPSSRLAGAAGAPGLAGALS